MLESMIKYILVPEEEINSIVCRLGQEISRDYADKNLVIARHFLFDGDREAVRRQAIAAALQLILEINE